MSPMRSIQSRRQLGESRIGCIFWLLVVFFAGYVAWQMVPIQMKAVDMDQFIVRAVERASLQSRNNEKMLRKAIMQNADELKLPLKDEDLFIKRTGARINVKAKYTVPINLIVKTWNWELTHDVERAIMRI